MQSLRLIQPDAKYTQTYVKGMITIREEGKHWEVNKFSPPYQTEIESLLENPERMAERIIFLKGNLTEDGLPEGFVPYTEFWLMENDDYIGRFSVRLKLNDNLRKVGGHIGYSLIPEARGKGYGTEGFRLLFPFLSEINCECPVLVTCNSENIGSRRVIEKNGGVRNGQVTHENGDVSLHYLINWQEQLKLSQTNQ